MEADRVRRAMELFQEIWPLSGAARAMLLAQWCGEDVSLRAQVEALLDADQRTDQVAIAARTGEFIAAKVGAQAGTNLPEDRDRFPILASDYRIIRQIGEGGMGAVYEAEQVRPRRRVALKSIRRGAATPQMLRRFEHEAQILGRLHHPGIAQIYEAGAADSDHPDRAYFVMEYVDGRPLNEYSRANKLTVAERVRLLLRVCDAVQHAHQRGVIHRDLKPANILVTADAQPKVLDFGVARLVEPGRDATTMHTAAGILVGTLAYMSPEQISGESTDVDTRADVYALGVLLYELLANRQPHDLRNCSIPEAARRICTQDPARLGTVSPELAGDLETIAARAMERDRASRYSSAAELAADLTRYVRHEPILARPASMLYRARKFALRHKAIMLGLVATLLALVAGVVATTAQAIQAGRARDDATRAESLARIEAGRARQAARESDAVSRFLQETLGAADPSVSRGREPTVRDALRSASERIATQLSSEPLVEAAVRDTIGRTYTNLAHYDLAEPQLRAALELRRQLLGPEHVDIASTLDHLATLLALRDDLDGAMPIAREALEMRLRLRGHQHDEVAASLNLLAELLRRRGDLPEATATGREALAILERRDGPEDNLNVAVLNNLGKTSLTLFLYSDAESYLRAAHELALKLQRENHPTIVSTGANLGWLYLEMSRPSDAEPILRATLVEARSVYGEEHPNTTRLEHHLASALHLLGDDAGAEPLARHELAFHKRSLQPGNPTIAEGLVLLADILVSQAPTASIEEALGCLAEAISILEESSPGLGWMLPEAHSVRGACLVAQGRYGEAEPVLMKALEDLEVTRGVRNRRTRAAAARLIHLYEAWGCSEKADLFRIPQ